MKQIMEQTSSIGMKEKIIKSLGKGEMNSKGGEILQENKPEK